MKIDEIKKQMQKILQNKKVMLACSTGVDSMVLLDLLEKTIKNENLIIAHVNHQKRKESKEEEKFINQYCEKKQMKCYIKKLDKYHGSNFQAWARSKRYEFFDEIAKKENVEILLLAHHANDNLETIIERFIRSSSLEGYAGIKEFVKSDNYMIYRPLITISKNDIYEYAKQSNLIYFEDASNESDDYMRNRIRHHIVPLLEKENPSIYKAVAIYSNTLLEANHHLENYETNFIKNVKIVNNNNIYYQMNLDEYLKENDFFKEQILFRLLKPFKLSKECIKDMIKQLKSNKPNIIKKINNNLLMIKEYGYVIFTTDLTPKDDFYLKITEYGEYNLPHNAIFSVNKNISNFITSNTNLWYNINMLPLIIRTRKDGDKIKTSIGTISISDYLTNHKVPYLTRKNTLILCNSEDQPLAILGYVVK